MKKKEEGFTLVETLIVSTFVVGTLVFLFSQFASIHRSYDISFRYNTIPGIYGAKEINLFLIDQDYAAVMKSVDHALEGYIDITDCKTYVGNTEYCNQLFTDLKVKTVLVSEDSLEGIRQSIQDDQVYSADMKQFLDRLSHKKNGDYRIIVEYQDHTFSSIKMQYV